MGTQRITPPRGEGEGGAIRARVTGKRLASEYATSPPPSSPSPQGEENRSLPVPKRFLTVFLSASQESANPRHLGRRMVLVSLLALFCDGPWF